MFIEGLLNEYRWNKSTTSDNPGVVCLSIKGSIPCRDWLWMMNLQQGSKFILEKYLYGAVCQDQLEKACLMVLFLFMDANSSNPAIMALNEL